MQRSNITLALLFQSLLGLFYGCSSLSEIIFEDINSLSELGEFAFAGCVSLRPFTIPRTVSCIPRDCFSLCESLCEVVFQETSCVRSIDECAFCGCLSLSKLDIPGSVERIERECFCHCRSLRSLTWGK